MNFPKFLLFACLAASCRSSLPASHFEASILASKWEGRPLLFLSCTRCGCIDEELARLWLRDSTLLQSFHLYGDRSCFSGMPVQLLNRVFPSTQSFLDSLDEENYNLVLFKKEGIRILRKTITTDESRQLKEKLTEFLERKQ